MKHFKENSCRLCKKVFCCINCRKKHEKNIHNIYPDCDICIYGQAILKEPSEKLAEHIKSNHWPLHCINCKRMFESINELTSHNKCPVSKTPLEESCNKTPIRPNVILENANNDSNFNSPPVMYPFGNNVADSIAIPRSNILSLTTSTPMPGEQEKNFLDNISQPITPVDCEKKELGNTNSAIKYDQPKDISNRRVTFNETPIIEKSTDSNKKLLKASLKKMKLNEYGKQLTPIVKDVEKENLLKTQTGNETLWETAISDSPKIPEKEEIISVTAFIHQDEIQNINGNTNESNGNGNKIEEAYGFDIKIGTNETYMYSNIWSSMTNLVKNVLSGLSSIHTQCDTTEEKETNLDEEQINIQRTPSNKRLRSESDLLEDIKCLKKMKITDIKCRKPINTTIPYNFFVRRKMIETCDKATQTD